MAVTHKLIETITVGVSGASTVSFSSIPQTYTDLVIVGSVRSTSTSSNTGEYDPMAYRFNATTSGYTARTLQGSGSAASSTSLTTGTGSAGGTYGRMNNSGINNALSGTSIFSSFNWYIPNYAVSTNKSWSFEYVEERNAAASFMELTAGLWSNTAAITEITLGLLVANYAQYSSFSLYGIKNS
jgi:hypothetical protein